MEHLQRLLMMRSLSKVIFCLTLVTGNALAAKLLLIALASVLHHLLDSANNRILGLT